MTKSTKEPWEIGKWKNKEAQENLATYKDAIRRGAILDTILAVRIGREAKGCGKHDDCPKCAYVNGLNDAMSEFENKVNKFLKKEGIECHTPTS